MKKVFLLSAMVCAIGITANAQLGKPTVNVKDTFLISEVYYNGIKLSQADWPDTIIVEDALKVYVAKHVYIKGKLKNSLGNRFYYYNAICNGKTSSLAIERNYDYNDFKYTIDNYIFIVKRDDDSYPRSEINNNDLFRGRGNTELESNDNKSTDLEWDKSQSVRLEIKDGKSRKETITIKRQAMFCGRRAKIPIPQFSGDINGTQGKVVVKIWVDRNGSVLKAECPADGSTTTDEALVTATRDAVLKARFSMDENAPEEQVGTVTIIFETEINSH